MGDFSAYDWRDGDFIDCDLTGVTALPSGRKLNYIYSRFSDWPDALMPGNVSAKSHDLITAWMRNASLALVGRNKEIMDLIVETIDRQYNAGFPEGFAALEQRFGMSRIDLRDLLVSDLFITAQHLRVGAELLFDGIPTGTPPVNLTSIPVMSAPTGGETIDVSGSIITTKGRWELARHLESQHLDHRFWIAPADLYPFILAIHRQVSFSPEGEEWWWTAAWTA